MGLVAKTRAGQAGQGCAMWLIRVDRDARYVYIVLTCSHSLAGKPKARPVITRGWAEGPASHGGLMATGHPLCVYGLEKVRQPACPTGLVRGS